MARQRKEPLEVLTDIIAKRQPLSLRDGVDSGTKKMQSNN